MRIGALPFVVAAGSLAAVLSLGSRARAFCRQVTATPPAGYEPTTEGCFGAQGGTGVFELYWSNLCVGYSLQKDASRQLTLDQATAAAAAAFAAWTQASCGAGAPSITAVDEGPVDCANVEYNSNAPNQHVIIFRDDGWPYQDSANTLGLTTVTYDTTDGEIFDADMEINSHDYTLVTTTPLPAGAYDLQTVLAHEAGHFLGLAHSADETALMYAHYQPGLDGLQADDIAAVCTVYPPGGARATSAGMLSASACDPTPRHGFSSACGSNGGDAGAGGEATGATAPSGSRCSLAAAPASASWWGAPIVAGIGWGALARRRRAPGAGPRLR
jgi:hypothetical protein